MKEKFILKLNMRFFKSIVILSKNNNSAPARREIKKVKTIPL